MNKLILLTGKDCPLCDEAKSLFAEIDIGQLKLEELDIYSKRLYLDKSTNNNLDDKFLYDYWKKIVNACFDQGFVLGFDFELPKII